jgi:hypothetical protein
MKRLTFLTTTALAALAEALLMPGTQVMELKHVKLNLRSTL